MPFHHPDPSPKPPIGKRRFSDTAVVRLCLPPLSTPSSFLARAQESYEYRRDRRRLRAQLEAFHHKSSPTSTTTTTTSTSTDESTLTTASAPPPIPPKSSARFSLDDRNGAARRATYAAPSPTAPGGVLTVARSHSDGGNGGGKVSRGVGGEGGGNINDDEHPLIFREKIFGSLRRRSGSSRTTKRTSIFCKRNGDVREIIEFPSPPHDEPNNNNNDDDNINTTDDDYTDEKLHPAPLKIHTSEDETSDAPLEIITPSEESTEFSAPSVPDPSETQIRRPAALADNFFAGRRCVSIMLSDPIVPNQSRQEHVVRAQALAASRPWWASVQVATAAAAVCSSGGISAWKRDDPMALTNDPWLLPPLEI